MTDSSMMLISSSSSLGTAETDYNFGLFSEVINNVQQLRVEFIVKSSEQNIKKLEKASRAERQGAILFKEYESPEGENTFVLRSVAIPVESQDRPGLFASMLYALVDAELIAEHAAYDLSENRPMRCTDELGPMLLLREEGARKAASSPLSPSDFDKGNSAADRVSGRGSGFSHKKV